MRALALLVFLSGCLLSGHEAGDDRSGDDVVIPDGGGGGGGFTCLDDSALEPNDTISSPFVTGVDSIPSTTFQASICPTNIDRDNYAIDLEAGGVSIQVTVTWDSGSVVKASLLNAGGTPIATGTQKPDGHTTQLCVPNLPGGRFIAQVSSNEPNNYTIFIDEFPGGSC